VLAGGPIRGGLQAHPTVPRRGGAVTGAYAGLAAGPDECPERSRRPSAPCS
jgi:hypothetical protein